MLNEPEIMKGETKLEPLKCKFKGRWNSKTVMLGMVQALQCITIVMVQALQCITIVMVPLNTWIRY